LLGAAAVVLAFAPNPFTAVPEDTANRVIRIEASQYAYSPGELRVSPGDTVTLELVSTDAVHGLYLDGYGLSMEADPGQPASMTFVADRPGSFRFRCNVTCGALHPFMIGRLNVGNRDMLYRGLGIAVLGVLGVFVTSRPSAEARIPA
jgi:heme/copper-type cytochrome/quinol oxidase subunit 2